MTTTLFPTVFPSDVTVSDIDLEQEEWILPDGQRLTPALAERLADHAQRGRPSLDRGVSPQVSFRVPVAEKDRLARLALRLGRRPSDVAREAFEKGLELVGS